MDNPLTEQQFSLQKMTLSFCTNRAAIYQDIQVFIEENFIIEVCAFGNNGLHNELGKVDWICKHLLLCVFLEIPKDKSLELLKEYSTETNLDLHGGKTFRHPNVVKLFLGNMEAITFSKPIDELIKIKEK